MAYKLLIITITPHGVSSLIENFESKDEAAQAQDLIETNQHFEEGVYVDVVRLYK